MKAEASCGDGDVEIMTEAQHIMNGCDEVGAYLDDDPADYDATMRDLNDWLDRLQRVS